MDSHPVTLVSVWSEPYFVRGYSQRPCRSDEFAQTHVSHSLIAFAMSTFSSNPFFTCSLISLLRNILVLFSFIFRQRLKASG